MVLSDLEEDAEAIREAAARSLGLNRKTTGAEQDRVAAGALGATGGRGQGARRGAEEEQEIWGIQSRELLLFQSETDTKFQRRL